METVFCSIIFRLQFQIFCSRHDPSPTRILQRRISREFRVGQARAAVWTPGAAETAARRAGSDLSARFRSFSFALSFGVGVDSRLGQRAHSGAQFGGAGGELLKMITAQREQRRREQRGGEAFRNFRARRR